MRFQFRRWKKSAIEKRWIISEAAMLLFLFAISNNNWEISKPFQI